MKNKIIEAGRALRTIKINYTEKDVSNEGFREVEPYSFRFKNGEEYFFGFDIEKKGIRQFIIRSINDIIITDNNYSPRWPVEL
ncbi:MAG: putative DNA-binding transcriptional regulator YafY [Dokdonia sp.]|jgi:predicted DNA-binding transcriptional regulator YafY